jgi:phospholipase C
MQTTASTAGIVAFGGAAALHAEGWPNPNKSGIDHIVVVMMENRSFDHLLGWVPGAEGRQAGLTYEDRTGALRPTSRLVDFQGCAHPDPDHSYTGGRVEYDDGRCDGWLKAGQNDEYAIGYYTADDLAFYQQAIPQWTVCDRHLPDHGAHLPEPQACIAAKRIA